MVNGSTTDLRLHWNRFPRRTASQSLSAPSQQLNTTAGVGDCRLDAWSGTLRPTAELPVVNLEARVQARRHERLTTHQVVDGGATG